MESPSCSDRWWRRPRHCSPGANDRQQRHHFLWSSSVSTRSKFTSAKQNFKSKGWQIKPSLMAATEAGPQRKNPVNRPILISLRSLPQTCHPPRPTSTGLLGRSVHHLPPSEAGWQIRTRHVGLVPAVVVPERKDHHEAPHLGSS